MVLKINLKLGGSQQSKRQSEERQQMVEDHVVDLTAEDDAAPLPPPTAQKEDTQGGKDSMAMDIATTTTVTEKRVSPSPTSHLSFEIPDHAKVSDYRTANFDQLGSNFVEQTYRFLQELCLSGSDMSDEERKGKLLRYVNEVRQRLIRLLALVSWKEAEGKKVAVLAQLMLLLQTCENYTLGLRGASDNLAFLHDEVRSLLQPQYDTKTALDILCNKKAPLMPTFIRDQFSTAGSQPVQLPPAPEAATATNESETQYALKRLSALSYMRLMRERSAVHEEDPNVRFKVRKGRTHIGCPGLFEVIIALDPSSVPMSNAPEEKEEKEKLPAKWVMQELNLLMGSCDNRTTIVSTQQKAMMQNRLQFLLDSNMAGEKSNGNSSGPILSVVQFLRGRCAKLVIYTCSSQLNDLLQGKLKKLIQKEDSSQEGLLRCLYWMNNQPTGAKKNNVKTYIELSLGGNGYSCKNIHEIATQQGKRHETEFRFDTGSISIESIVWQGAILTAKEVFKRVSMMLGKDRHFQKLQALGISAQVDIKARPTWELGFFLSGTPVVTMNIDVYTGTLLFSARGNDRSNLRILSLLRQFRQKHFNLLSSAAELLGNEQLLVSLLGHVNSLLEKVHACMALDEIFGVLWRVNSSEPLREVPLDTKNAMVWNAILSSVGFKHEDMLLLNRLGTQTYIAFLVTENEKIASFKLRISWRFDEKSKADQLLLEEKQLLCTEDLKSLVLGDGTAGSGEAAKASRKRKLDQDLGGKDEQQTNSNRLAEFVKLTTIKAMS
jgi:hypothetical protein